MAQFAIYLNGNADTKAEFPYLLDIQSPLLSGLGTRLVIPLIAASNAKFKAITTLTPSVEIG